MSSKSPARQAQSSPSFRDSPGIPPEVSQKSRFSWYRKATYLNLDHRTCIIEIVYY